VGVCLNGSLYEGGGDFGGGRVWGGLRGRVQVKIHPTPGAILSGPPHKVTEIFENIPEQIANHKFIFWENLKSNALANL